MEEVMALEVAQEEVTEEEEGVVVYCNGIRSW